nr:cadherin-like beta sandwich domain-containing protein [uncultured Mucilaginibacter sp.]
MNLSLKQINSGTTDRQINAYLTRLVTVLIALCIFTGVVRAKDTAAETVAPPSPASRAAVLSNNANLTSLSISSGTLSPVFNNATLNYKDTIANAVTSVTITGITQDSHATIKVNNVAVASGTSSASLPMAVGNTFINVTVIAENSTVQKQFIITVHRLNNGIAVSGISVAPEISSVPYQQTPTFQNAVTNYALGTLYPANDRVFVIIKRNSVSANATAVVNGVTAQMSGSDYGCYVPVVQGSNDIQVVIRAEDGSASKTFHFSLNRPYNNADLSRLAYPEDISNFYFKPATFSKDTTTYLVLTKPGITSIYLAPQPVDSYAVIKINGVTVTNGRKTANYPLVTGGPTATVVVTARDGVTAKTYTVNAKQQVVNNKLISITLNSGSLSPAFSPTQATYTVAVSNATTVFEMTAVAQDSAAKIQDDEHGIEGIGSIFISQDLYVGTNRFEFFVMPSDDYGNDYVKKYTVNVIRQSVDASLSNLTLSSGVLRPAFSPSVTSYKDTVDASSITITPTATNNSATIKVNGVAVASGSPSASIPLAAGDNTITTLVTAEDPSYTRTYTTTVTRIAGKSLLADIILGSGSLSPAFLPTQSDYDVTVPNATASITIKPVASTTYPGVTIKVNGTTVTSGTFSAAIPLSLGNNLISVMVTAADLSETHEYKIVVKRQSNNANLATLTLSEGSISPALVNGVTNYTAEVSNSTPYITIYATTQDANAKINGYEVTPQTNTLTQTRFVYIATNTLHLVVTAEDGTVQNYTLNIIRPSDNSNLKNLTVSSGRLSPAFEAGTLSYADTVTVSSVTITPQGANPNAKLRVNGVPVANNTASASLPLAMGNNVIPIQVTSQDSSKVRTYTVNVVRITKDALLANLQFSGGTLSPFFLPTAGNYKDTVSNATSSITVKPVADPAFPNVTVKVNGTSVTPGTASPALPLIVGNNRIITVVTSAGGTLSQTYTTMVTRLSDNANLANIVISSGTLSPAFAAGTLLYSATVPNSTGIFSLTPTAANPHAKVSVNGTLLPPGAAYLRELPVGRYVFTITVVSEDESKNRFYNVVVTKLSNNSNLSKLTLSAGTLSPAFTAGSTSYTASVSNATTTIKVTPTAANANAYIKVNGITVATGTASPAIPLAVGPNTISTVVVSQDSSKTRTYAVTITRAPASFALRTPQIKPDLAAPNSNLNIAGTLQQPIVRQAVSPNGDGINDILLIDGIESFADNTLKIMNRDGNLVFEKAKYDNISRGFDGHSGINGKQLPAGTYFYSFEYTPEGGRAAKRKTGFFVLKY